MSSNFNNTNPAAPANCTNVAWQTDGSGNDSANVPTPFLLETDVFITSLMAGDVLIWSGSEWVNGFAAGSVWTYGSGAPSTLTGNGDFYLNTANGNIYQQEAGAWGSPVYTPTTFLAPLASPALTGTPTAPTKSALTNNTDIATTAYTDSAVAVETSRAETAEALLAAINSQAFTGTPSLPTGTTGVTQSALNNSTKLATTAYADAAVAAAKAAGVTVNAQSSSVSAYTAVLGDANNLVTMSDASASTFTVPPNSSVAFPVGAVLTVIQYGAGQITLTAGAGVTFYNPSSLTTRAQYSTVSVVQVSANTWVAGGDLT